MKKVLLVSLLACSLSVHDSKSMFGVTYKVKKSQPKREAVASTDLVDKDNAKEVAAIMGTNFAFVFIYRMLTGIFDGSLGKKEGLIGLGGDLKKFRDITVEGLLSGPVLAASARLGGPNKLSASDILIPLVLTYLLRSFTRDRVDPTIQTKFEGDFYSGPATCALSSLAVLTLRLKRYLNISLS